MIKKLRLKPKTTTLLLFLFVIALTLLLRVHIYLTGDFYFLSDQARDMLLVKDIVVDHNLTLIGGRTGLGGVFHGPLYLYFLTPFFFLSEGNPFLTLVPASLLISIATVAAAFIVVRKLFSILTAFIFSLLIAVNPVQLDASFFTSNAQFMPLVFVLYLYALLMYLRGKENYLVLSALLIGIGIHFESAFAIVLIPLTILGIFIKGKIPKPKVIAGSILVFALAVSNFLLFELRNKFLMTNSILNLFKGQEEPIRGYEQFSDFNFLLLNRLSFLVDYLANSLPSYSIPLLSLIAIGAVGIIFYLRNRQSGLNYKKELIFLVSIPFVVYGFYLLYPFPLWPHYIWSLIISAALLVAIALSELTNFRQGKPVLLILLIAILIPSALYLSDKYPDLKKPAIEDDSSYRLQLKVVEDIFSDAGNNKFGYFQYSSSTFTYSMDYLMWWLDVNYPANATNQKERITYLIMFKELSGDRKAHEFWKSNVVKISSQPTSRNQYKEGIVVEKYLLSDNEPLADPSYYQNLIFR